MDDEKKGLEVLKEMDLNIEEIESNEDHEPISNQVGCVYTD